MRAQLTMQALLMVLLAVAMSAGFYLFMQARMTESQSAVSQSIIYPESPPQITTTRCYLDHGYLTLETDQLAGTVRYQVKELGGSLVKDGSLAVNLTGHGRLFFGAPMGRDTGYSIRLYTPKWSVDDTCTARLHHDAVLYLPFDEGAGSTAYDQTDNGNDGAVTNVAWVAGVSGSALHFNGQDAFVGVPDGDSLDLTDAITVSAWVNETTEIHTAGVVGKQGVFDIARRVDSSYYNHVHVDGDYRETYSNSRISSGEWHHLVMTYDSSTANLTGYVDGSAYTTTLLTGLSTYRLTTNDNSTEVGRRGYRGGITYFNGTIDEVYVYDRALTADEVAAIHSAHS